MANSTQLSKAAAESIGGFFSASQENLQQEKKEIEPETQGIQKEKQAKSITQTTKKPQTTSKRSQPKKNVLKEETDKNEANTKRKKQTFSFRAAVENIINWKAYATATGQTMETLCTAAINEYLTNHTLTGNEQIIFEAMKERDKNK